MTDLKQKAEQIIQTLRELARSKDPKKVEKRGSKEKVELPE